MLKSDLCGLILGNYRYSLSFLKIPLGLEGQEQCQKDFYFTFFQLLTNAILPANLPISAIVCPMENKLA